MDFTANEGSGLNSTGGSNPPVSAFGPGPRTGAFCVPGPCACSLPTTAVGWNALSADRTRRALRRGGWQDWRMAARSNSPQPDGVHTAWNPRLALLVAAAFFMEFLDGTVLTTAIPSISADFAIPAADVNITMTAYLLTVAIGIPLSGWLAERFGARRIFCTAIAVFTLSSLACALSQDLATLTLSRIAQGAGGAMMVPVGTLVVLRGTPKSELLRATGGRRAHHLPVVALDFPGEPAAWRGRLRGIASAGSDGTGRSRPAAGLA